MWFRPCRANASSRETNFPRLAHSRPETRRWTLSSWAAGPAMHVMSTRRRLSLLRYAAAHTATLFSYHEAAVKKLTMTLFTIASAVRGSSSNHLISVCPTGHSTDQKECVLPTLESIRIAHASGTVSCLVHRALRCGPASVSTQPLMWDTRMACTNVSARC